MTGMPRSFGLCLLLSALAHAQIPSLAIQHFTLPNGMEVIENVDRRAPIVHLNFRYRVGAKHERPGQNGLAHLFEHLLFQAPDPAGGFGPAAERIGATNVNAGTEEDYTEFYETVPASRLERMLWMESNRFAQFLPHLTQANLDRQRDVVINEKREKVENAAYGRLNQLMLANAFPRGHPYQHDVTGSYADLRALTLDDVRAFYTEHYTPDQVTLAIAGDFDPVQTKQWIAKYFGSMAPGSGLASPPRSVPPLDAPRVVELEDRVRTERIYFYWPTPPMAHHDQAALAFAGYMLADDNSPRNLHLALTDQLSLGVSIERIEFQDASLFCIFVSVAKDAKWPAIESKIASELARLAREGPSPSEMTRARNSLESDQIGELETLAGRAGALQNVRQFYGGIGLWGDWATRYSSVTADDVRAAVGRWLTTPNHLAIHVRPQTAQRDSTPEPDRTQPPPFQPEKPYRPPEVQSAKLPNGLQILVMERHELPKVAVQVRFRVGSLQNPPGKQGLAALTAATAGKGTATRKEKDLNTELADLAAIVSAHADSGSQSIGLVVLRRNLEPAFRLLSDVVRNASFPDYAVDAQKKGWLDEMEKPDAGIDDFAHAAVEAAFGAGHPLGETPMGSPASLRSLTARDARDFHARYWTPDIAAVVFAGDVTLKDAVAMATESLGSWTGAAPPPAVMPPPKPKPGRIFLMDRKGASQTMVVQVVPGIPRDSPDYPALLLADRVFGEMSANRLSENIRQQKGIAYFAASQLWHYPGLGLWVAWSPVQVDRTAVAIREFQKELRGLGGEKPITAVELDQARNSVNRWLPEQYETVWPAAEEAANIWASGLPVTELQTLPQRIAATTLAEVNAAARKYARAGQAFFVLVGDRGKIEPQLHDLGLGPIAVVE